MRVRDEEQRGDASKIRELYNKDIPPEVKKKCYVNSMDAKALYPSVTKAVANEAIKDLVNRS